STSPCSSRGSPSRRSSGGTRTGSRTAPPASWERRCRTSPERWPALSPPRDLHFDLRQQGRRGRGPPPKLRGLAVGAGFGGGAGDDGAAGGEDEGDSGGHVPLVLGGQRPGGVGEAGGDEAELVGHGAGGANREELFSVAVPLTSFHLAAARQHRGSGER